MKAGERDRACWDKELRTQGWAPSTGSPSRRETSVLQEEEGGLQSRLSDSASRPRGPTSGGSECVEGSRGQGDSGNWRGGLKGLMQPVVASLIFSVSVVTSSGFTCAHLTVNINKF